MIYFILLASMLASNLIMVQSQARNVKEVKIGAIFFADEQDVEEAFKMAIKVNNKRQRNNEIYFVPIVRYTTSDDSNVLQKLACDLIANNTIAIFGPSSKASSDIVASICNYFQIPHIRYDWKQDESTIEKLSHSMTINLYPSIMALSKFYQHVILELTWRSFTILYEDDFAMEKFQDVLQLYPIHRSGIRLQKIYENESYDELWKNLYGNYAHKVILDCSSDHLKELLVKATEYNMTTHFKHILLTDLDNHLVDIEDLKSQIGGNITMLRMDFNEEFSQEERLTTVKSAVIYDGVQLLISTLVDLQKNVTFSTGGVSCMRNYKPRSPWYHYNFGETILNYMKEYTILSENEDDFVTQKMEFDEFGERTTFDSDYYYPLTGLSANAWGKKGKEKESKSKISSDKPISLSDRPVLRVMTKTGEPYLMIKEEQGGEIFQGNSRYQGYVADLLNKLSQSDTFPFDYTIELVPGNEYGKKDEKTGEWTGIIRALIDGRADFGICDLTVTQERREAVDFSVPFMSLGVGILYYNKPPPEPELFSFLKPFSLEVWYYVATSYLIVSILLFLLSRIAENEYENPHPCNPNPTELENKWVMTNTTWLTMGSIMGQGCDILPRNGSMRLVNGMWWFFALMMLNSYTANLAAFLTYSRIDTEITGLNSLAEQNKIQFGTFQSGSTATFFRESNDSIYRLAWSKMVSAKPSVFTKDNHEGIERVKKQKGAYAYFIETTTLEYNVERHCDVKQVGPAIGEKHYAIALPKDSPYRSNLSVSILKLGESGELFSLKKKWWKTMNNVTCEKPDATNSNELSISQVGGVFLLLGGGLLASYVMGICEFLGNVMGVAVEEKISTYDAFRHEINFAMKFWINKKPIRRVTRSITHSRRSSPTQSQNNKLKEVKK